VFAAGAEIDDISLEVYQDDLKTVPESKLCVKLDAIKTRLMAGTKNSRRRSP
jgi:hypothetical protein